MNFKYASERQKDLKSMKTEMQALYYGLRRQGFTHQLAMAAVVEDMFNRCASILELAKDQPDVPPEDGGAG